jgi:hypothetical protein
MATYTGLYSYYTFSRPNSNYYIQRPHFYYYIFVQGYILATTSTRPLLYCYISKSTSFYYIHRAAFLLLLYTYRAIILLLHLRGYVSIPHIQCHTPTVLIHKYRDTTTTPAPNLSCIIALYSLVILHSGIMPPALPALSYLYSRLYLT